VIVFPSDFANRPERARQPWATMTRQSCRDLLAALDLPWRADQDRGVVSTRGGEANRRPPTPATIANKNRQLCASTANTWSRL
jgi:hypothetical protein